MIPLHGMKPGEKTVPSEINGQCIAVYVRRADKYKEMKLLSFSRYSNAVERLWEEGYMRNTSISAGGNHEKKRHQKPVIFIGTEDNDVLEEAIEWGKKEGYRVKFMEDLTFSLFSFNCFNVLLLPLLFL